MGRGFCVVFGLFNLGVVVDGMVSKGGHDGLNRGVGIIGILGSLGMVGGGHNRHIRLIRRGRGWA